MANKGIETWKYNPAGPGSGHVAKIAATGKVVYNGRLDGGPHDGLWIRIVADENDVIIGKTDDEIRREMERRYGGPRTK